MTKEHFKLEIATTTTTTITVTSTTTTINSKLTLFFQNRSCCTHCNVSGIVFFVKKNHENKSRN